MCVFMFSVCCYSVGAMLSLCAFDFVVLPLLPLFHSLISSINCLIYLCECELFCAFVFVLECFMSMLFIFSLNILNNILLLFFG